MLGNIFSGRQIGKLESVLESRDLDVKMGSIETTEEGGTLNHTELKAFLVTMPVSTPIMCPPHPIGHIYALVYNICFSLSDLLHSV